MLRDEGSINGALAKPAVVGHNAIGVRILALTCAAATVALPSSADDTFVYAVQISATVQASPPQIGVQWESDPYGAISYAVYRKAKDDSSWGAPIASLPGSEPSFATRFATYSKA